MDEGVLKDGWRDMPDDELEQMLGFLRSIVDNPDQLKGRKELILLDVRAGVEALEKEQRVRLLTDGGKSGAKPKLIIEGNT